MAINKVGIPAYGPFKLWTIQNFPFIEEDFDAITNYQLYSKIIEFCKKVAENQNILDFKYNELIDAFNELEKYVDNYFANLDVQEEINNKLDEMAESGELSEIIAAYLEVSSILVYDTLADLKAADNLIDGSIAMTLGYHSIGDGGTAKYKIRGVLNTDDPNDMDVIALTNFNTLVAEIVLDNTEVIVNQFGAYGDGSHDDTDVIQYAIEYTKTNRLAVKFLNKVYLTTEPLTLYECTKLIGNYINDEYDRNTTILNVTSDTIEITSNTVGIHIENILFKSSESTDNYFVNDTSHAFQWCEFTNVSFRNYKKVFNIAILGCRFNNVFINHVKSAGTFTGSDNTFTDWFIGTSLATESDDAMVLHSVGLSRFTNLYFTGKTANDNGCNNILKIENGYSNNLLFTGCYFDFSNGSAIDILGQGGDFPDSGCCNITFDGCLFRGNCCSTNNVKHIINIDLARNVNINNCSFMTQDRYTVNANSKIYNLGQYAQGVSINNNFYGTTFSYNGDYIYNAQINEPYIEKYNRFNLQHYSNVTRQTFNLNREIKCYKIRNNYTTGATYGEVTINLPESFGDNPIVTASVTGSLYVATINSISSNQVQLIVRNVSNGNPVLNQSVNINLIVYNQ